MTMQFDEWLASDEAKEIRDLLYRVSVGRFCQLTLKQLGCFVREDIYGLKKDSLTNTR